MSKVNRAKFKQDSIYGKGAKFSGWKDKGETTGWIHPTIGLWERWIHGSVPSVEERDGKTEMRRRRCNCIGRAKEDIPNDGCPMCQLQEFASMKLNEGADGDEVILEAGSNKDRVVLDLNDLAGKGNFRTDPKVKGEVCFAWIAKEKDDDEDAGKKVEIITGPHTLGERILEVIEEQVTARGEMAGDCEVPEGFELKLRKGKLVLSDGDDEIPWQPYPFKLKYKEEAQPASKYSAMKVDSDLCPLTPAIIETMLSDEDDLDVGMEKLCGPTEVDKQLTILESSWDSRTIPYEEFAEFFFEKSGKKRGKAKKTDDDDDEPKAKKKTDDDDDEPKAKKKTDDDDDEPKAKKKKTDDDDDEPKDEKPAKIHCFECGFKNKADTKFCSQCGSKLRKVDDDDDEPKAKKKVDDDDDEPKAKKKKADDDDDQKVKKIKCKDCGALVVPMKNSGRCPECGEKLGEDDVPY